MTPRARLLSILTLCTLTAMTTVRAQSTFGIKLGYVPASSLTDNNHVIVNGYGTGLTFNTSRANHSIYAGGFYRYSLEDGFFLQGEALYNFQTTEYLINYLDNDAPDALLSDEMHHLALPISIGVEIGMFEVLSGITTEVELKSTSELSVFDTFADKRPFVGFGWHTGILVNMHPVFLETRYQLNFNNYGADLYLYDQHLRLSNAASKLILTAGLRF